MNQDIAKDIVKEICAYLTDKDKLSFLMMYRQFNSHKQHILFTSLVKYSKKIYSLPYYDNFVNFIAQDNEMPIILPKNTKHLHFRQGMIQENIGLNHYKIQTVTIKNMYHFFTDEVALDASYIKHIVLHTMDNDFVTFLKKCINLEQIDILGLNISKSINIFESNPKLNTIILNKNFIDKDDEFASYIFASKNLTIGYAFNRSVGKYQRVKKLIFNCDYDPNIIKVINNYSNLKTGDFKEEKYDDLSIFNKLLMNMLNHFAYHNLQYAILDYEIEQLNDEVYDSLIIKFDKSDFVIRQPCDLRSITFNKFNKCIGNMFDLCYGLQSIFFDRFFNKPVNNMFDHCYKLRMIKFGHDFDQPIDTTFKKCKELNVVHFGTNFNKYILDAFSECHALSKIFISANRNLKKFQKNNTGVEIIYVDY